MLSLAAAKASLVFLVPPTVSVAARVPAVDTTAFAFKLEAVGNQVSSAVVRIASLFQGLWVRLVGLIFRSLLSVIFCPRSTLPLRGFCGPSSHLHRTARLR